MGTTDLALLRRWVARGDAEAFDEIVRRHAGMVYNTCRRVVRNGADTEDVAQVVISGNETREMEVNVPNPVSFPIQILEQDGKSPRVIKYSVNFTEPDGSERNFVESCFLDGQGRTTVFFYGPAREVWVSISRVLSDYGAISTESAHHSVTGGETLPEETILLEPVCGITALVRDANGNKLVGPIIYVEATCNGKNAGRGGRGADPDGRLTIKDSFGTGTLVFKITADQGSWESGPLECTPDALVDLGEIVLTP